MEITPTVTWSLWRRHNNALKSELWVGRFCGRPSSVDPDAPICASTQHTQRALSRESPLLKAETGRTWHTEQALNSSPCPSPMPEGCDQDRRCTTVSRSLFLEIIALAQLVEVSPVALHITQAKRKWRRVWCSPLTQTNKGRTLTFAGFPQT